MKLVQELDASWTKKFESLGGLLKRALSDAQTKDDGGKKARNNIATSDDDILVVDEEETDLDKLENDLLKSRDVEEENHDTDLLETIASELNMEEKLGEKCAKA